MALKVVKQSEQYEENWEDGLSPNQMQAALLIGHGQPKSQTAKKVGVTPQTISAWMSLPHFKDKIEDHRKDMFLELRNDLRGVLCDSVKCMRETLRTSKDTKLKVSISKYIIEKSHMFHDELGLYID